MLIAAALFFQYPLFPISFVLPRPLYFAIFNGIMDHIM